MKRTIMILLAVAVLFTCSMANATQIAVFNTSISVYTQSNGGSDAHMIQSVAGIFNGGDHPYCGRRVYIDFADKEILASALAASVAGRAVNFLYDDAVVARTVMGHAISYCKVFSIWY